jgi:hypothetical protein
MDLYEKKYYKYKLRYFKLIEQLATRSQNASEQLGGGYEVAAYYVKSVLNQIIQYNNHFVDANIKKYMSILKNKLNDFDSITKYRFNIDYIKELDQVITTIISINKKNLSENVIVGAITNNAKQIIQNLNELIEQNNKLQKEHPEFFNRLQKESEEESEEVSETKKEKK